MLDEVIAFAIVMVAFEFVILCMVPPRPRLRMLGSPQQQIAVHALVFAVNMTVHWGTVVGTMSATLAFIVSLGVVAFAKKVFGYTVGGRYYHVGWVKYSVAEIK